MSQLHELRQAQGVQAKSSRVSADLNKLIQKGQLFNARLQTSAAVERLSTGYTRLDHLLGGGLSLGHLHEVQVPGLFSGESLVFKASVQRAASRQQPVFWLNPPAQPFLPGLNASAAQHMVLESLAEEELQWSAAQILRELKGGVVLIWHPHPSAQTVRTWQRSLQADSDIFVLVISQHMAEEARAYSSRVRLCLRADKVHFEILKRPGGWPVQTQPERIPPWS